MLRNRARNAITGSFAITAMLAVIGVVEPGPAHAQDSIGVAIDRAVATQPDAYVNTPSVPEGQVDVEAGTVTAPAAGADDFSLVLPSTMLDELNSPKVTALEDVTVAVRDEGDGAFRALFHIPTADSPTDYRFEIGEGFDLVPLEDGGFTVRTSDGDLAGVLAAPWALDANGSSVATEYLVEGNVVTQRVMPTPTTIFPVVADPFWIPALLVVGHLTRHAAMRAAQRGISQALIKQTLQQGAKSAGKRGTTVFTRGKGASRVRVVVDSKTGNIITVTKG